MCDGKIYKPSDTITIPNSNAKAMIYYLVAHWKPTGRATIYLDPGFDNMKPIELTDRYLPGDKVSTEELQKLIPDRPGYELLAFEAAYEGLYEIKGLHDYVFIPKNGIKITALWRKEEFLITYHYGFDSSVIFQEYVDAKTTLSFDSEKIDFIDRDGYTFLGWSLKNEGPINVPLDHIISADKNQEIDMNGTLDVYSCYERWPAPESGLMVIYNTMGGEGGPEAVVYYDDKKDFRLSDKIPTRNDFTFDCWLANGVEITNLNFDSYIVDNVLELKAKWRFKVKNILKDEYQSRYGKKIMPDFYFLTNYESREWEKINEHCYFAIKTELKEAYREDCDQLMVSHILIIDYDASKGGWNVSGVVDSLKYMDFIKDEIISNFKNNAARIGVVVADGINFTLKQIKDVKWVMEGIDIATSLADLAYQVDNLSSAAYSSQTETAIRIISSDIKSKLYATIRDIGIENKQFGNIVFAESLVTTLGIEIDKCVEKAVTDSKYDITDGLKFLSKFAKMGVKYSEDWIKLIEKINQKVNNEIGTKILNGLASKIQPFDDFWKQQGKEFGKKVCTGIDAFVLIVTDLSKDIKYQKKISKDLDPVGEWDLKLARFYDKIDKTHRFSSNIKNSLPLVIEKIYTASYPIN